MPENQKKHTRRWRRIRHVAEYLVGRPLVTLLRTLPQRAAILLGDGVAHLMYFVLRSRRAIGLKNLTIAFPELSRKQHCSILSQSYKSLGRTVVELLRLPSVRDEDLRARFRYAEDSLENLEKAHSRGKGVILFGAHIGNWELLGLAHALNGHPFHIPVQALNNRLINHELRALRARGGNQTLERSGRAGRIRELMEKLRDGATVGLLIDLCPRRSQGILVPFFGRETLCHRGPAVLALRTGAALVPGFLRKDEQDETRYTIHLSPELEFDRTDRSPQNVLRVTAQSQEVIEAEIRSRPEEWLWIHRRWKRSPALAADAYPSRRRRKVSFA